MIKESNYNILISQIEKFAKAEKKRIGLTTKKDIFNPNRFEPKSENRELILQAFYPTILKLSKDFAMMLKEEVSVYDVFQNGVIGALIGIDKYIKMSESGFVHTAKISVYVHSWIKKYTTDYEIYYGSKISYQSDESFDDLSFENFDSDEDIKQQKKKTKYFKQVSYSESDNNSDDSTENVNYNMKEIKEIIFNDSQNQLISMENDMDSEKMFNKLFSGVNNISKQIIFMYFGIGVERETPIKDIAQKIKKPIVFVNETISKTLEQLKNNASKNKDCILLLKNIQNVYSNNIIR